MSTRGEFFGHLVCHLILAETHGGLVLIDAGLPSKATGLRGVMADLKVVGRPVDGPGQSAAEQIVALGYSLDDVQHIILTHLDFDHVGGLVDFPNTRVHVLKNEQEAAMPPVGFLARRRYQSQLWALNPKWVPSPWNAGEAWNGFERTRRLPGLPPEILMVPMLGHTYGHVGVAVEARSGWLLHAGDAFFHKNELTESQSCPLALAFFQRLLAVDKPSWLQNRERLRTLAKDGSVAVLNAHDPDLFDAARARDP